MLSFLKPNDVVDIIAPSAPCHESVPPKVNELIQSWGLSCHIPAELFGDDLLCANSDEVRFEQLKAALFNEHSQAVWCLLGGYGCTKLLPKLNQLAPPKQQKIFMGFSDITGLHIFLQKKWGWTTLHTPSARQAALQKVSQTSVQILKNILFRNITTLQYKHLIPLNDLAKKNNRMTAPLIGGNLQLIQTTIGTPWQLDASDKILFIEEVKERAYRVERTLEHLMHVDMFQQAKAILFGDMLDIPEPDGKVLLDQAIKRFATRCQIPALQLHGIGHGETNHPLILGAPAQLQLGNELSLTFNF